MPFHQSPHFMTVVEPKKFYGRVFTQWRKRHRKKERETLFALQYVRPPELCLSANSNLYVGPGKGWSRRGRPQQRRTSQVFYLMAQVFFPRAIPPLLRRQFERPPSTPTFSIRRELHNQAAIKKGFSLRAIAVQRSQSLQSSQFNS